MAENKIKEVAVTEEEYNEYLELKEKATTKPVVVEDDGLHCPSCKLRLETRLFDSVYCHYCGQRLE